MHTDDRSLARLSVRVGQLYLKRRQMLSSAESCTGGFIAKVLTDIAGSSAWFLEGMVTYSNAAKANRLGVPRAVLRKHGAVSEATVRAMVLGVLRRGEADVAVAVTGIAGPGGASAGKPVGTIWIAWAARRPTRVRIKVERKQFRGDRDLIRRKTVRAALQGLLRQSP